MRGSLRLVLLFALRYEREGRAQTTELLRRLEARGLSHAQLGLARTLLVHAGAERRTADLFSDRTFSSRFATLAKQSLRVRPCCWRPLRRACCRVWALHVEPCCGGVVCCARAAWQLGCGTCCRGVG